MGLTAKQARFVAEYVRDSCATKAAIRAGYAERAASSQGHELLAKPEVAEAIRALTEKIARDTAVTAERVISELALYAFVPEPGTPLADDQVNVKPEHRIRALELLGKRFGLFTDRFDHRAAVTLEQLVMGSMRIADPYSEPPATTAAPAAQGDA